MMTCHLSIHPAATCTHRSAPVNEGQRRRSTTVKAAVHRSIAADHGGDRRSTTVAGGEPPLTAAGPSLTTTRPPLTTTGPPVNGDWWAGQSRVWIGSGPGPSRGMPRVHTC
nr:hypothetical protein [Tanacetum cinerariifolium]